MPRATALSQTNPHAILLTTSVCLLRQFVVYRDLPGLAVAGEAVPDVGTQQASAHDRGLQSTLALYLGHPKAASVRLLEEDP